MQSSAFQSGGLENVITMFECFAGHRGCWVSMQMSDVVQGPFWCDVLCIVVWRAWRPDQFFKTAMLSVVLTLQRLFYAQFSFKSKPTKISMLPYLFFIVLKLLSPIVNCNNL